MNSQVELCGEDSCSLGNSREVFLQRLPGVVRCSVVGSKRGNRRHDSISPAQRSRLLWARMHEPARCTALLVKRQGRLSDGTSLRSRTVAFQPALMETVALDAGVHPNCSHVLRKAIRRVLAIASASSFQLATG